MDRKAQSIYDRQINKYKQTIKNCLLVYIYGQCILCFEYQKRRFVTNEESLSTIYMFEENKSVQFSPAFYLSEDELFLEVLYEKFSHTLYDGNNVDGDLGEVEYTTISKTRQQFIEAIESLKRHRYSQFN